MASIALGLIGQALMSAGLYMAGVPIWPACFIAGGANAFVGAVCIAVEDLGRGRT